MRSSRTTAPKNYVDAYMEAAGIWKEKKSPLFRTLDPKLTLSDRQLPRTDALRMVKRRAVAAGLSASTCNHTFRATTNRLTDLFGAMGRDLGRDRARMKRG